MFIFSAGNLTAWLWFLCGVIMSGLLITAIGLAAHTLSFYWGETAVLGQMVTEFTLNFAVYPDKIYAPAARALMYSLIPIGFAVHIPLRLSRQFSPGLALAALGAATLYCAAAGIFFYRGLRRYESGNVIVTRM